MDDVNSISKEQARQGESLKVAHNRIKDVENDIDKTNENVKNIEKDTAKAISEVLQRIDKSIYETQELRKDHNKTDEKVTTVEGKISELEKAPGKRLEGIASQILSIIVAGVVGFVLAQFGM